jgi:amino acid adenylation domain-containing protein
MSSLNDRVGQLTEEQRNRLMQRLLAKKAQATGAPTIQPRGVHSPCPLSHGQELMWVLDRLTPGGNAYNAPGVRHVMGMLNVDALRRSLDAVVARHEILRTTYEEVAGSPVQVIADHRTVDLPMIDLSALPEPARTAEAQRWIVEESQRPFDLRRDVMLRAALVRLAEDEHLLLFAMHHIATDGWSKEVMYKEIAAIYEAFLSGREAPLAPMRIQYADYATWQRGWLRGERLERLLTFWRGAMAGAPPVLELPIDHARPAVQTVRGKHRRFMVSRESADGLRGLCQREGATLYMIMLAAFKVLLQRYTGQENIVVGSPIAARNLLELEGLIGYFSNTLMMHTDLSGDPTFRELIQRVRATTLAAYDHQDMPFEKLVVELRTERDARYPPLVQVAFILHNRALGQAQQLPGLTMKSVEIDRGTAKFDLTLAMIELDGELMGSCEFNTDLFEESTIARMQDQFCTLLEGVVADPDTRISVLPLLPVAERTRTLVEWNDTRRDASRPGCLHHLVEQQAGRRPDAVAVEFEGRRLTYRELNEQADRLSRRLREHGVGPDVPVGIYLERSLELAVALLGVLKAGGACLPLDVAYPADRLAVMLEDGRVPVLLTREILAPGLPRHGGTTLYLDPGWDGDLPATAVPAPEVGPQNLAYVIFTSGSTGRPKGVMLTHLGLVNHQVAAVDLYGFRPDDRVLQFASLGFDLAIEEMFPTWAAGGAVIFRTDDMPLSGPGFLRWLEREKISVLDLPTAFWNDWVRELAHAKDALPRDLRLVIVGGEKATANALASWRRINDRGVRWVNTYGPTEASVIATAFEPAALDEWLESPAGPPIGRPIANTEIYILDGHRQPVPIGVAGEIHIGGEGLARGYLGRPDLTAERFIDHPFRTGTGRKLYRTGDLARHRSDGLIEFLGRNDEQVKIRGFRIEPGEIAAALVRHPAVRDAAVVAREETAGVQRLAAYIVALAGTSPTAADLRDWLKQSLPDYMMPSAFVFLDQMPLTPNGKIDHRALPAPSEEEMHDGDEFVAPRTPVEEILANNWADVLGLQRVGVHENFFQLGGHSLLATRMVARVRDELGIELPLRMVFESPTIAQLSELVVAILEHEAEIEGSNGRPDLGGAPPA